MSLGSFETSQVDVGCHTQEVFRYALVPELLKDHPHFALHLWKEILQ
jgi:hypothetical protein